MAELQAVDFVDVDVAVFVAHSEGFAVLDVVPARKRITFFSSRKRGSSVFDAHNEGSQIVDRFARRVQKPCRVVRGGDNRNVFFGNDVAAFVRFFDGFVFDPFVCNVKGQSVFDDFPLRVIGDVFCHNGRRRIHERIGILCRGPAFEAVAVVGADLDVEQSAVVEFCGGAQFFAVGVHEVNAACSVVGVEEGNVILIHRPFCSQNHVVDVDIPNFKQSAVLGGHLSVAVIPAVEHCLIFLRHGKFGAALTVGYGSGGAEQNVATYRRKVNRVGFCLPFGVQRHIAVDFDVGFESVFVLIVFVVVPIFKGITRPCFDFGRDVFLVQNAVPHVDFFAVRIGYSIGFAGVAAVVDVVRIENGALERNFNAIVVLIAVTESNGVAAALTNVEVVGFGGVVFVVDEQYVEIVVAFRQLENRVLPCARSGARAEHRQPLSLVADVQNAVLVEAWGAVNAEIALAALNAGRDGKPSEVVSGDGDIHGFLIITVDGIAELGVHIVVDSFAGQRMQRPLCVQSNVSVHRKREAYRVAGAGAVEIPADEPIADTDRLGRCLNGAARYAGSGFHAVAALRIELDGVHGRLRSDGIVAAVIAASNQRGSHNHSHQQNSKQFAEFSHSLLPSFSRLKFGRTHAYIAHAPLVYSTIINSFRRFVNKKRISLPRPRPKICRKPRKLPKF